MEIILCQSNVVPACAVGAFGQQLAPPGRMGTRACWGGVPLIHGSSPPPALSRPLVGLGVLGVVLEGEPFPTQQGPTGPSPESQPQRPHLGPRLRLSVEQGQFRGLCRSCVEKIN